MKIPFAFPYRNCWKSWFNFQVMLWYTWYAVKHLVIVEYNAWRDAFKRSNYD